MRLTASSRRAARRRPPPVQPPCEAMGDLSGIDLGNDAGGALSGFDGGPALPFGDGQQHLGWPRRVETALRERLSRHLRDGGAVGQSRHEQNRNRMSRLNRGGKERFFEGRVFVPVQDAGVVPDRATDAGRWGRAASARCRQNDGGGKSSSAGADHDGEP
jgi:hypothetical protein